jgi:hypothetical protein
MQSVTTGEFNTAVGRLSGGAQTASTGSGNSSFGNGSLNAVTSGNNNSAFGASSLRQTTTGGDNTVVGHQAMDANTTGSNNTAVGRLALFSNTTGTVNVAVGIEALTVATTGTRNVAVGDRAGFGVTTGVRNTYIGGEAGYYSTTGSGNTLINPQSSSAYAPVFDITTESNRVAIGSTAVTNAYIRVAWTVTSDARDKMDFAPVPHGLDFVRQLQPTAYYMRQSRDTEVRNGRKRYGFKAQDIMALEGEEHVIIDNEQPDHLKYNGEALVPVLTNAIKEMADMIDQLKAEIATLKGQP